MIVPLVGFCGAWRATPEAHELLEDILSALGSLSDKEACVILGSPQSHFSDMKSLVSSGPGILRWAQMPTRFWVWFVCARARRFCLTVIEDARLARFLPRLRMVKAELPDYHKERVG